MTAVSTEVSCTLNGVIVDFDLKTKVKIGTQAYVDEDQLRSLRQAHRDTRFFRRDQDKLISISIATGQDPIGDDVQERRLADLPPLVSSLVLEALLRYFHSHGRPIWRHRPLRVVSNKGADQLLRGVIPKNVEVPTWIEQRVSYVFDTRIVYPESHPPAVLLVCDVKTCNVISATCDQLLQAGVPLEHKYVQIRNTVDDPRLSPKPRLIGRVIEVQNDKLLLDDHLDGYSEIAPSEAYLEPTPRNFSWCIEHIATQDSREILARLEGVGALINSGPERLRRIRSMFDHLRNASFEIVPGCSISLGSPLKHGSKATWFPKKEIIRKPPLVFAPVPGRTDIWNERGLDTHGPYDQRHFTPKRPRIAVVCQAETQGDVEQFLRKFFDGIPNVTAGKGRSARTPYGHGFVRRYALEGVETQVFTTSDASASAYQAACRKAIESAARAGHEWNLALVQIDDAFHLLSGDENPYLVTKSLFMKHHIPVQEVTIEKMVAPPADLVYIMNDISLAAYAKLGGVPWLLSADTTIAHELVIGLGSHHVSGSRLGTKERVVGITTVFTGDGRYLLDSRTAAVPYEKYAEAILDTLQLAIDAVRRDQNWRPTDAVRLIFHAFKPFRDVEVEAVDKTVKNLGFTDAQYAFLHVVDEHPFLVFDETNTGVYFSGSTKKGAFAPERGTALKFNRDETLVSFTGAREVKQPTDGMPKPILLRLHRKSTFKDTTYLSVKRLRFLVTLGEDSRLHLYQ